MWKFTWILLKSGPKSSYLVVFRGVILLNNLRNKVCEQLVINLLCFTSYTPSYNITKPYVFRFRAEKKTPRRSAFKGVVCVAIIKILFVSRTSLFEPPCSTFWVISRRLFVRFKNEYLFRKLEGKCFPTHCRSSESHE